jgi:CBS domain-containing protein
MNLETIYRPEKTVSIDSRDSIAEAAGRMQFTEISALVVFEADRFAGIITERDLVRAMSEGVDPDWTPCADYMTEDPVVVDPETDVHVAAERMVDLGVRHLPVMVGDHVVGMVSARDLLLVPTA